MQRIDPLHERRPRQRQLRPLQTCTTPPGESAGPMATTVQRIEPAVWIRPYITAFAATALLWRRRVDTPASRVAIMMTKFRWTLLNRDMIPGRAEALFSADETAV